MTKSSTSLLPLVTLLGAITVFLAAVPTSAAPEQRILNCPIKENVSRSDCEPVNYALTVFFAFLPAILMALGTLFTIPFFFCGRYCCNCCGGSRQTEGYCCGGTTPARYSWFEILRVKIYAVVVFIFAIVSLVFSVTAAAQGRDGIDGFFDGLKTVPDTITAELDIASRRLTVETYNKDTNKWETKYLINDNPDINKTVKDISKKMKDGVDQADGSFTSMIDTIMTVLFVIVLLPAIAMGLNLLFALLNVRNYGPMLNALFIMFLLVFLWLAHGALSVVAHLTSDICAEIQGLGRFEETVATAMIECPTSLLNKAREAFTKLEKTEAKKACDALDKMCVLNPSPHVNFATEVAQGRIYDCVGPGNQLNCTDVSFETLLTYTDTGMTLNSAVSALPSAESNGYVCRSTPAGSCSVAKCAETCTLNNGDLSVPGKTALAAISVFKAAAQVSNVFAEYGARFYVCESLLALMSEPMVKPCNDISEGLFNGRMSTGVEAVFCVFAIIVCCYGQKRFLPLSDAGKVQDPEREMLDDADRGGAGDVAGGGGAGKMSQEMH